MVSEQWIFLDGELVTKEDAVVSVYDHGFLYGDGVFEGVRSYNGNIFRLNEHLTRLYESAKSVMIDIPYTKEEMTQVLIETLRKNNLKDAYIRLVVSRGVGDLGLIQQTAENLLSLSLLNRSVFSRRKCMNRE